MQFCSDHSSMLDPTGFTHVSNDQLVGRLGAG